VFTGTTKPRMRQKTVQLSISQVGFGSAISRDATGGFSCDSAAKPELIDSCTASSPGLFVSRAMFCHTCSHTL